MPDGVMTAGAVERGKRRMSRTLWRFGDGLFSLRRATLAVSHAGGGFDVTGERSDEEWHLAVALAESAEAALGVEEHSSPLTIRAQRRGRQSVQLRVATTGRWGVRPATRTLMAKRASRRQSA